MPDGDGYRATMQLANERPDLIPHLRRALMVIDSPDARSLLDDIPQDVLDEFVRRGILQVEYEEGASGG